MNIDYKAPLVEREEIIVKASMGKIWDILTDINNWPLWQKKVTYTKLSEPLAKNVSFSWKSRGMRINSVFQNVVKPNLFSWTGKTIGVYSFHTWKLEKQAKGTKVVTEESMSGWLTYIMRFIKPDILKKSLMDSLTELKIQSEKLH